MNTLAVPTEKESTRTCTPFLACMDEWTDRICRRTDELLQSQGFKHTLRLHSQIKMMGCRAREGPWTRRMKSTEWPKRR